MNERDVNARITRLENKIEYLEDEMKEYKKLVLEIAKMSTKMDDISSRLDNIEKMLYKNNGVQTSVASIKEKLAGLESKVNMLMGIFTGSTIVLIVLLIKIIIGGG